MFSISIPKEAFYLEKAVRYVDQDILAARIAAFSLPFIAAFYVPSFLLNAPLLLVNHASKGQLREGCYAVGTEFSKSLHSLALVIVSIASAVLKLLFNFHLFAIKPIEEPIQDVVNPSVPPSPEPRPIDDYFPEIDSTYLHQLNASRRVAEQAEYELDRVTALLNREEAHSSSSPEETSPSSPTLQTPDIEEEEDSHPFIFQDTPPEIWLGSSFIKVEDDREGVPLFDTPSLIVVETADETRPEALEALLDNIFKGARHNDSSTLVFKRTLVIQALEERFGKTFIQDILQFYPVNQHFWTENEIAAFAIGIATNLTLEAGQTFTGERNEALLIQRISTFRNKIISYIELNQAHLSKTWEAQCKKDYRLLKKLQSPDALTEDRFSCSEFLARKVAYCLFNSKFSLTQENLYFQEGMLISLSLNTNTPRLYTTHHLVNEAGVYGMILVPAYSTTPGEGFIVFRGTFDLASVGRDVSPFHRASLEPWPEGPGAASFAQYLQTMLVNCEKQKHPFIKTWNFTGHSLAGSDIARLLAELAHQNFFDSVAAVNLFAYNATGVEKWVNKRFLEAIQQVSRCQFSIHHLRARGDLVSLFGIEDLGTCSKDTCPSNLKVTTTYFSNKGWNPIRAHQFPFLLPSAANQVEHRRTLLRNTIPHPDDDV